MASSASAPLADPLSVWMRSVGQRLESACNDTLAIGAADVLWYVESGGVEIYAAEHLGDGRLGGRRFVCGLDAPALVCGLSLPADMLTHYDLVMVSRGAVLVELNNALLQNSLPDRAIAGVSGLLEKWIAALTEGVTRTMAPRTLTTNTLAAAMTVSVEPETLLNAAKGVVWAKILQGSGRYLGQVDVSADQGHILPLTHDSWLTETGNLKVSGQATLKIMRQANWWSILCQYHSMIHGCLSHMLVQNRQQEHWRLDQRAKETSGQLDDILAKFIRLVGRFERQPLAHDSDNALAMACAAVCKPLGVTLEPSPHLNRRRADDRPLTVQDVARTAGIRVRQLALRGQWWCQDNGPMVAFAEEDERPLALLPISASRYQVQDVLTGQVYALTAEIAQTIRPLAWSFYAPLPDGKVTVWGLLMLSAARQKSDILIAVLTGLIGGLLALAAPVASGLLFKHVIPGHHVDQLLHVGLGLVMVAAVTTIVKLTGDVALLRMEGRVAGQVQAGIIDRLLRLPSAFFNQYSTGDLAQRALSVESVRKAVAGLVLSSLLAGVFSIFSFGLLFLYQPWAALASGGLFVVILAASVVAGMAQVKAISEGEQLSGNIFALVLQMVTGIQKLRMAGAEDRAFIRWASVFAELRTRMVRGRRVTNAYTVFMSGWDVLTLALVFLVIAMAQAEQMETGAFMAFVTAFSSFMASVAQVGRAVMQCYSVAPMIARAQPLLAAMPEVDGSKVDPGRLTGDMEVNSVFFRYDRDSPRVLNGLSLTIRPGQFVALVGPSGCGKSTLMKLLLGFERPESGGIFFDGRDLRTLDVQAVRRQIGVVLQSGRLMPGSLFENIKGAVEASVDEAWDAAAMAGLDADIRAMPMGMHTVLTEGSATLSGGQIQRLLIARALVSKPRIVLFDEATSALDNRTQAVVTESLGKLSVTRIAIAHRLSTVKDADQIFVLNEGKVAESGQYDDLMAKEGLFSELARRQLA